ncbi:MAG: hypothetical protein GY696_12365 [Gammaproteobacteria bacterium]|nr:hypothetical protein [Gammaproteobacteria bacterium]
MGKDSRGQEEEAVKKKEGVAGGGRPTPQGIGIGLTPISLFGGGQSNLSVVPIQDSQIQSCTDGGNPTNGRSESADLPGSSSSKEALAQLQGAILPSKVDVDKS